MMKSKILKGFLQHLLVFIFYSLLFYGGIFLGGIYIFHLTNPRDPFAAVGAGMLALLFFTIPSIIIAMVATYFILKKMGYRKKDSLIPLLSYFAISLLLFFVLTALPIFR